MNRAISDFKNIFFIGIAGTGMSAIAQYLSGIGKSISGSDRYFVDHSKNETKEKLEKLGISCFTQNGEGIQQTTDLVVVSTAIEDSVIEVIKAKELSIPILKRSEVLALIAQSKKTIAVGGTSGKSTTCAMLYEILKYANLSPSIISGAGLVSIIKEGKIGNAAVGKGEWLIIEADESDGSIVQYTPEIGVLLNVDKDHQEMEELIQLFSEFKKNTKDCFIVNRNNTAAKYLSSNWQNDFSSNSEDTAGWMATSFKQVGMTITFNINGFPFTLNTVGYHNMENAVAAVAVAQRIGVSLEICSKALAFYEGIYRRHQLLGINNGVYVIDDYAHNPVKCASSIKACQAIAPKVIAWFQPHGYGPTRFLKNDFITEISAALRPDDEIWMSEIFYAGGTAEKNISANDLIKGIQKNGKKAFFVEDRNNFLKEVNSSLISPCVLLLMGARDPGLEDFSKNIWSALKQKIL